MPSQSRFSSDLLIILSCCQQPNCAGQDGLQASFFEHFQVWYGNNLSAPLAETVSRWLLPCVPFSADPLLAPRAVRGNRFLWLSVPIIP
jgi:hypothetical protein